MVKNISSDIIRSIERILESFFEGFKKKWKERFNIMKPEKLPNFLISFYRYY